MIMIASNGVCQPCSLAALEAMAMIPGYDRMTPGNGAPYG